MSERKQIHQEFLTGERALFASNDLDIYDTIFDDGESPLKESHGKPCTVLYSYVTTVPQRIFPSKKTACQANAMALLKR